jgi:hypothetical protein
MKELLSALLLFNSSLSELWASPSQGITFSQAEIGMDKDGLKYRKPTRYHRLPEIDDMKRANVTLAISFQEEYVHREELDKFISWMVRQKRPFDINLMVDYLRTKKNDYTVFKTCAKASFGIEKEDHLRLLRDLCFLPENKEKEISGLKFHN